MKNWTWEFHPTTRKKKDEVPWWLGWLNFIVLQWFFVRRAVITKNGKVIGWCWIKGVVPITGWWGIRYRYINAMREKLP